MANYPSQAGWEIRMMRKIASTAFSANELVARSAALDTVEPADASDSELVGICLKEVTSADSDYASNTRIPVLVPVKNGALFVGDVTTGSIAVTDEGNEYDIDAASGIDASASTTDAVKLVQYLSSTKGVFALNQPDLV